MWDKKRNLRLVVIYGGRTSDSFLSISHDATIFGGLKTIPEQLSQKITILDGNINVSISLPLIAGWPGAFGSRLPVG